MLSRAQGCLLGQFAGDALGSLVEFQTPEQIREEYPNGVRELVPWKEPKKYLEALQEGKYDWSHIACQLWPDRVKEKCRTDRSIAHRRKDLCEVKQSRTSRKKTGKLMA